MNLLTILNRLSMVNCVFSHFCVDNPTTLVIINNTFAFKFTNNINLTDKQSGYLTYSIFWKIRFDTTGFHGDVMLFKNLSERIFSEINDISIYSIKFNNWKREHLCGWTMNRRLCRNYELLMASAEEMVKLSAIKLLIKHYLDLLPKGVQYIPLMRLFFLAEVWLISRPDII